MKLHHRLYLILLTLGSLCCLAPEAGAIYPVTIDPLFTQLENLTAPDGAALDEFGESVAISGDTVVVGASGNKVGSNFSQGAAYVFERNQGGADNWGLVKKLTASDGEGGDHFGNSVAISGDTIVVAAQLDDDNWGSVYIFARNQGGADNWGEVKKLTASDGAALDLFGKSVAIDGDTVVVGADGDDAATGSVYIFARNQGGADNWGQVKKLSASDGMAIDRFGASVAISGDTLIVGAVLGDVGGNSNQGSAYLFVRNQGGADQWGQVRKLTASDGATGDQFGRSVASSGDTVVVGAVSGDAAYTFTRNQGGVDNWGQVKKLTPSDGAAVDQFGSSVAISGDTVIVGAPVGSIASNQGAGYAFARNQGGADNWGQSQKLTASGVTKGFGISVAISGDTVVIGANLEDVAGNDRQGAAYTFVSECDQWVERRKATASDGAGGDQFGVSIAISGDTAVVGANLDDVGSNENQGSAYVLERNQGGRDNWGRVKKLTAPDGAAFDMFGESVGISGDTIVVGAHLKIVGSNQSQGAAYVFARNQGGANNWGFVKKLTASDGLMGDNFGASVAISNDTIVVGAELADIAFQQGAAYIFARNQGGADNWGEVKKLVASDGGESNFFGESVAIDNDTVIVGASGNDVGGNERQGSVYIFERNQGGADNWGEVKKISASDGEEFDLFGNAVAIDGDTLIVGASTDNTGSNGDQGAAYIFARNQGGANNWGEVKKITASDGTSFDFFGDSVAIDNDTVIVGASFDEVGSNQAQGSAYLFERNQGGANNWGEVKMLTASDGAVNDSFGFSVGISTDIVIVGARNDEVGSNQGQGSAYAFVINCPPIITTTPITRERGKGGSSIVASVSDDLTESGSLTVTATPSPLFQITNITNSGGVITANVKPSCSAPLGDNLIQLTVADEHGLMATADLTIKVTPDVTPPVVACPPDQVVPIPPGATSVVVNYPDPGLASENCPGASLVCNPPQGSVFSLGTTTVTCTATDTSGNTNSCAFTVTTFDICLQNGASASTVLLFNSSSGDYLFCCGATKLTGKGAITRKGGDITLTHYTTNRRVLAKVSLAAKSGTASLQFPVGATICTITDQNINDNTCACSN